MTYIEGRDYFVRYVDLPDEIGGMVTPNEDYTFSVYLNARHTPEQQARSFKHELKHITEDDFYNDRNIEEIEK